MWEDLSNMHFHKKGLEYNSMTQGSSRIILMCQRPVKLEGVKKCQTPAAESQKDSQENHASR